MEQKKAKKWFLGCLCSIIVTLILCVGATVIVDPYFHYHGPIEGFSYRLREDRYTNPGILKNYEYDAVIMGTSMIKNFKPSQMDELFAVKSVKTPIPGGMHGDMRDLLEIVFEREESPQLVLLSLDPDRLINSYTEKNNESVPYYLYDNSIFNDASYVLNKEILVRDVFTDVVRTLKKQPTMSLDEYSSFASDTGKTAVLKAYDRLENIEQMSTMTDEQRYMAVENLAYNCGSFIEQYPETKFIFFVPPYSMIYWDNEYRKGELLEKLEAKKDVVELLLQYPNVEIYCFNEKEEWITNLDYYIDDIHYDATVSEEILQYISEGKYRITKDNLEEHFEQEKEYLLNFPYDIYFETK